MKPIWKVTYCIIPTIGYSEKDKTMGTVKRLVISRGVGDKYAEHRNFFLSVDILGMML